MCVCVLPVHSEVKGELAYLSPADSAVKGLPAVVVESADDGTVVQ